MFIPCLDPHPCLAAFRVPIFDPIRPSDDVEVLSHPRDEEVVHRFGRLVDLRFLPHGQPAPRRSPKKPEKLGQKQLGTISHVYFSTFGAFLGPPDLRA